MKVRLAKIYLAHSHRHRLDGKWIQRRLEEEGHQVYNPFDADEQARELTEEWGRAEDENDGEWLRSLCAPIIQKDLSHIMGSDVVVVYYPDESTGTAQEIGISSYMGKTIYVLTEMIHPFIQGHQGVTVLPANSEGFHTLLESLAKSEFKIKGEK